MRTVSFALLLVLLAALPARAEEDTLRPSPHATPEAALGDVARRGHPRTREAEAPVAADVVGAVTPLGGRLGFMPLLQHHMAVEHWFLEGDATRELTASLGARGRRFVRLRGQLTLLGVFGGQGLDWYGNGLQHERDWGPVMGYHERVYRFAVDEVVWVRTREEQAAVQSRQKRLLGELEADMARLDWTGAASRLLAVVEGTRDAGLDPRGLDAIEDYLRRMLVLERDPATWTESDRTAVAESLVLEPFTPYKEMKTGGRAKLLALVAGWPEAVRVELGPRAVAAWNALEYRFQRDKARAVVFSLDVPPTQALAARLAEAEAKLAAAKERLEALRAAGDYAGMLAVLEEVAADQALILDYALVEQQTQHWVPAARRLAALEAAMDDPAGREALLMDQIRETVAEGTGLPNQSLRPRYDAELIERFVPRLTAVERERIETLLLDLAKPLRPSEDWQQVLLVAELLSGFGGDRARAYYPELLAPLCPAAAVAARAPPALRRGPGRRSHPLA